MKLIVAGINHKTANLELREKFSLTKKQHREVLEAIKEFAEVKEGVVLSTCNRTEFYLLFDEEVAAKELVYQAFDLVADYKMTELEDSIYLYHNLEAVQHLYQVAGGLDSLVIGESQIVGQVKSAFELAQEFELVDTYFHQLFSQALKVAKQARSKTKINAGAASVSYAAVELAKQIFGCLAGKRS